MSAAAANAVRDGLAVDAVEYAGVEAPAVDDQEADVISAIQRAIELKNTYNIRVINLSLGRPVFESYALDPLCQAVLPQC